MKFQSSLLTTQNPESLPSLCLLNWKRTTKQNDPLQLSSELLSIYSIANDLHREDTAAFSKPILIDIKCFKDLRSLPACCLWAISGLWKLLSPDAKWCPNVAQHHSNLTATEVKYFVPETLRIKFLSNQPELVSQNTCWLHRKASADYVTARVNPEQRTRTQTCSNAPNLVYLLKLTPCLFAEFLVK